MPYPDAASAPVVERDIAAAAIPALLGDEHIGVRYALTGPQSLTQAEQVQVIGAAIGRDLVVAELPPEEFRQAPPAHLPPPAVDDMLQYLADHVGTPSRPADPDDDHRAAGHRIRGLGGESTCRMSFR